MSVFRAFKVHVEITSQLRCVLFCQFSVYFSTSELSYKCLCNNDIIFMTSGLRFFMVRFHYVWK